jgi:hypothetical protein
VREQQHTEEKTKEEQAFGHQTLPGTTVADVATWGVPTDDAGYVERLTVRPVWWAVALGVAVLAAAELAAGFHWKVGLLALAAALIPAVSVLAILSRLTIRVDERGLHAGGRTMTYDEMESVEALDARQTKAQVGPGADPAAFLVFRGYVRESVVVRPLDPRPVPYWLVSTRRPAQVVAAVERAARAAFSAR